MKAIIEIKPLNTWCISIKNFNSKVNPSQGLKLTGLTQNPYQFTAFDDKFYLGDRIYMLLGAILI